MNRQIALDADAATFQILPVKIGVEPLRLPTHLAFGAWGLLAARTVLGSIVYARSVACIYAFLTVQGPIPFTGTTFGLVPIDGNDIWLHAGLAVVTAYFGFVTKQGADRYSRA